MDYCIKNHKNVFIKLNENGRPVTCTEQNKTLFEFQKAKNICDCLPKTLKKLKFKVEAIPDIKSKEEKDVEQKNTIQNYDYVPSESVTRWIEKFGMCGDILDEAEQREKQLLQDLDGTDKELLDILHIIEIEKSKDLYNGWKLYKRIKSNRRRRRNIKDELLIIEDVLEKIKDISCLHRERVQRAIDGLFTRKYKFRIIEVDESNEVS